MRFACLNRGLVEALNDEVGQRQVLLCTNEDTLLKFVMHLGVSDSGHRAHEDELETCLFVPARTECRDG